jgi:hypothetical protein
MSELELRHRYANPPEKMIMVYGMTFFLISIIFAVIIGLSNGKILEMLSAGIILGFLLFFISWLREYYRKPIFVEIQKDGLVFINRYRNPSFIQYDQIVAIGVFENWGTGGIILRRGSAYPITYEIARSVRDAYFDKTGTAPREWNGKVPAKAYRKSIGMER